LIGFYFALAGVACTILWILGDIPMPVGWEPYLMFLGPLVIEVVLLARLVPHRTAERQSWFGGQLGGTFTILSSRSYAPTGQRLLGWLRLAVALQGLCWFAACALIAWRAYRLHG